jgi:hypothetical protein
MVDPLFSESIRHILSWVPTVAVSLLFRYAFSDGATTDQVLTSLSVVMGSALLVVGAVVWKVRRIDK